METLCTTCDLGWQIGSEFISLKHCLLKGPVLNGFSHTHNPTLDDKLWHNQGKPWNLDVVSGQSHIYIYIYTYVCVCVHVHVCMRTTRSYSIGAIGRMQWVMLLQMCDSVCIVGTAAEIHTYTCPNIWDSAWVTQVTQVMQLHKTTIVPIHRSLCKRIYPADPDWSRWRQRGDDSPHDLSQKEVAAAIPGHLFYITAIMLSLEPTRWCWT